MAKDLRQPKYRQQRVASKKTYDRKRQETDDGE